MKKVALTLICFMTAATSHALPLGNPSDASLHRRGIFTKDTWPTEWNACGCWSEMWSARFGFYGNYVFDKYMKADDGAERGDGIRSTEINTNAGYLAFNFCNRVDLFATLGVSNIQIDKTLSTRVAGASDQIYYLSTSSHFSWSLGTRATLWQWGCLTLGAEAQYFQADPSLNYFLRATDSPQYFAQNLPMKYEEWQLGLGVSYRVNIAPCSTALIPYAGLTYDRTTIDSGHALIRDVNLGPPVPLTPIPNMKNSKDWGYAVGITLASGNCMSLAVEGRYVNERALYINTQFRF